MMGSSDLEEKRANKGKGGYMDFKVSVEDNRRRDQWIAGRQQQPGKLRGGRMRRVILGLFVTCSWIWTPLLDAASPNTDYAVQGIGALPGDNQSIAWGVNDSGSVVGRSFGPDVGERAFYWDRPTGTLYQLTTSGATGAAFAIAGGSGGIAYAVGYESSPTGHRAVIWIAPPTSGPVALDGGGSEAWGVNDNGVAVGTASGIPVIWAPDANDGYVRTNISLLPGHGGGLAEDIDNDGIVVGNGFAATTFEQRGFLRLLNGSVIELAPAPGDIQSRAAAVSDIVTISGRNLVYVAGRTENASSVLRGVRWTVDVDTGAVVEQTVLSLQFAEGVNGAGDVAGASLSGRRQSATLWRNGTYITLDPPPGGRNTASLGMVRDATSPTYVVGASATNKSRLLGQAAVWEVY
jgi:hypothetical protein